MASATITETLKEAVEIFVKKSHDACFIDWVIGSVFAYVYIVAPVIGWSAATPSAMWPVVGALACTRFGDMIKRATKNYVDGKYVHGNGSTLNQTK